MRRGLVIGSVVGAILLMVSLFTLPFGVTFILTLFYVVGTSLVARDLNIREINQKAPDLRRAEDDDRAGGHPANRGSGLHSWMRPW